MNQMEIFKNPEFGSIRTFEQDGKVLFCGTDVATALGYANPRKAVRDHTRCGTKCSIGVQTGKKADGSPAVQMVEMLFIPEGDVYRLIVHSKLPSAERFERWVFDEVLPSIRQHGAYLTREKLWEVATSPEALLKLCSDLLAEREKNAALQADNARLQGKAVYYDLFIDLRHSTNLRTTAKELDVPERRFIRFLLERRYVYRTPSGYVLPYAKGSNEGLFCVKDFCRNGHTGSYTLVTPKGKLHFAELRQLIWVTVCRAATCYDGWWSRLSTQDRFLHNRRREARKMQEEVENRTLTLVVSGTKFTGRLFKAAISKYMAHRREKKLNKQRGRDSPVTPKGKQTVKQLIGQNQGVSNIEINDPSIRDFERIARKYGVDYAVKKDRSSSPPKYLIFFKGRDADALTAAFTEYTGKKVRKAEKSERPSVLAKLSQFKELVKHAVVDRNKRKELER